ncbi:putative Drug resistance protein [Glarea lozoyensis 74030]|uniref:Putative Drug resistance protein n=1 Tax=Glarea lozoyensis (strain ATCC 74030 / MF5533) TaxID=1104152 RepID=H0EC98_GLAL7|nr:putative Drug resistance protein [Glarea lozoyensis 74030]
MIGAMSYFGAMLLFATMRYGEQSEKERYWSRLFPALVLSVIGADLQFNVANMYVLSSLPSHQQSLAGGIFNTITKVGTAVGLGIFA